MSIQQQVARPLASSLGTQQRRGLSPRLKNDLIGYSFVLPFLLFYAVFLLWPIILGLVMSFYNWSLAITGTPKFIGLQNYQELFGDPDFWSSLGHTLYFTILSTPVLVIIALSLALLANRKLPVRWLFRLAFFAPVVLPVAVVTIIWGWLYQPDFGLINTVAKGLGMTPPDWLNDPHVAMFSVVILTIWWTVGSNFLLYLAGLQQIPRELYEAASIDGANGLAQIRYITIPQLGRMTTLIVILQVIASLQVYAQIALLTGGGPNFSTRPIIQYILEGGFTNFRIGYGAAVSYVLFALMLIVTAIQFPLFQRQRRSA